jgi:hypothetical protein
MEMELVCAERLLELCDVGDDDEDGEDVRHAS